MSLPAPEGVHESPEVLDGDSRSSSHSSSQLAVLVGQAQHVDEQSFDDRDLLFGDIESSGCGQCCRRRRHRTDDGLLLLDTSYPMYVIGVKDFLELERLEPHQIMLERGLLQQWTPVMEGRTILTSHEWLGYDHCDPNQEHIQCLQGLFNRLMRGEIASVDTQWSQQKMGLKGDTSVTANEWIVALPRMVLWWDFMSIPQSGARSTSTDAAEQLRAAASASAGLTEEHLKMAQDLKNVVESIPAYVERATLLLILSPVSLHMNRQQPCDLSTWRRRGWCRLELQAALLRSEPVPIMVCCGADALPYFLLPTDACKLLCGTGDFTCCQRGHCINGGRIECDKAKVRRILSTMITIKEQYLDGIGEVDRLRWIRSTKHYFLKGLPVDGWSYQTGEEEQLTYPQPDPHGFDPSSSSSSSSDMNALAMMQKELHWNCEDEEKATRNGKSLLYYSTLADDLEATTLILAGGGDPGLDRINISADHAKGEMTSSPLMNAMVFGRNFEHARLLLYANADPQLRMPGSDLDAFTNACIFCNMETVTGWLQHFRGRGWDLEQICGGMSPLLNVATYGSSRTNDMVMTLVQSRADVHALQETGGNILCCVGAGETNNSSLVPILTRLGVHINSREAPTTIASDLLLKWARFMVRIGVRKQVFHELAKVEKWTPLHAAAAAGKVAEIQEMLEARANPLLRNQQGMTALDVVRQKYGVAPPLIHALLMVDGQFIH